MSSGVHWNEDYADPNSDVALAGGANGIGKAAVQAYAKAGAKVAVVDRDAAGAQAVAEAITMANGNAISSCTTVPSMSSAP